MTKTKCSPECCQCKVAALINVDERGQMVLPKKVRDEVNIKAGEKLAVVACGTKKDSCCLCLVKAKDLNKMAKDMLGPMMKEMVK